MDKCTFRLLLRRLKLNSSQVIPAGEKLMIFLFMLCNNSNRSAQERFQHSGETISRCFKEVMRNLLRIQHEYIREPPSHTQPEIANDPKRFPYFKDCIGAIDGTHIPAVVSGSESSLFRNRKGYLSQNVLAVANFDMSFSYCWLAGKVPRTMAVYCRMPWAKDSRLPMVLRGRLFKTVLFDSISWT
jgi:hypothetical protein